MLLLITTGTAEPTFGELSVPDCLKLKISTPTTPDKVPPHTFMAVLPSYVLASTLVPVTVSDFFESVTVFNVVPGLVLATGLNM